MSPGSPRLTTGPRKAAGQSNKSVLLQPQRHTEQHASFRPVEPQKTKGGTPKGTLHGTRRDGGAPLPQRDQPRGGGGGEPQAPTRTRVPPHPMNTRTYTPTSASPRRGGKQGQCPHLRAEVGALDAQLEAGGALQLGLAAAAGRLADAALHGRHAARLPQARRGELREELPARGRRSRRCAALFPFFSLPFPSFPFLSFLFFPHFSARVASWRRGEGAAAAGSPEVAGLARRGPAVQAARCPPN